MVLVDFLIVLGAAFVILATANFALKSAVKLAHRFGMSDIMIGMTILSIGTSLPEIMTHVIGSIDILRNPSRLNEISGLVIGTNVGSDVFQQNFALAAIGLVGIIAVHKKRMLSDMGGLIGAAALLFILSIDGFISRFEGGILFFGYIAYLFWLKSHGTIEEHDVHEAGNPWLHGVIVFVSFGIMAFAAELMVSHADVLVENLPISHSFFGVIVLGVAAAFPEIITALLAILKKNEAISAGVLIGSNVTNPMFALGLGALISTYTVPSVVIWYDLPVKIATALLILYFLWDGKMKKHEAIILILLYLAYLFIRNMYFPVDF